MAGPAEQKKSYQTVKSFRGLNTRPNRTALDNEEFAWLENVQPIGFGNLKVVPTYSNTGISWSNTVSSIFSCNINNVEYIVAFELNGGAEYYRPDTNTKATLATAGTFSNASVRMKQWKNERAIIADPAKGYFTWDGTSVVVVGSIGTAGITNPGTGYTTAPSVTVSAPNATNGVQATMIATISNNAGTVQSVTMGNIGSGYTSVPAVTFSAPSSPYGVQAQGSAVVSGSTVIGISITNPGYGYNTAPTITISGGAGVNANATAVLGNGIVTGLTITNAGSGYIPTSVTASITSNATTNILTVSAVSTGNIVPGMAVVGPNLASNTTIVSLRSASGGVGTYNITPAQNVASQTMTIVPGISFSGGGGSNAAAIAAPITFAQGTVGAIVTNSGSGYTSTPTVTFTGGGATRNATGTAIVFGGMVTSIIVTDPGAGYTSNATVTLTGGGATAPATAQSVVTNQPLSDVASFQGRVWLSQGRTVYYSAAGQYNDFISVSAGNELITDDTLHSNITSLTSANNFLYVFGDDSINVFSDVRVNTNGTTTFTNTNVSASTGSSYADGIFPYFRSLLFINNYGVFALIGATVSKISDALDGVVPLIDFTQPVSGGQVLINNILSAAFNVVYNDPVAGARPIQLVFFDKKWFVTSQDSPVRVLPVATARQLFLYGTSGTNLLKFYADSSSAISSTIKSALWPMQDTIRDKQALKFGIEASTSSGASINVTVDSETNTSPVYVVSNKVIWTNNSGSTVAWTNNSSATVIWIAGSGYSLYKSDAQQYGKYLGLTLTSTSPAFTLNTLEMEYELRARF
jgi:hypothetical protein